MKAVIMAGGKGTRLRPLTCNLPKPMVPLLDKPCMEYMIELLKKHGITEIAVTVQYMPDVIRSYFGDGSEFGVKLHYFEETTPLGTAGSVKNAQSFLDERFIVISGDALTDFDLKQAEQFHEEHNSLATMILTRDEHPLEFGVVMTDEHNKVVRFLEKPEWGEVFSDTINTGIYILEPEVLDQIEYNQVYDFSQQLFPKLLEDQQPLYAYISDGYWSDIGSLKQYRQTQFDMLNHLVDVDICGTMHAPGIYLGNNVRLEPSAQMTGPIYIGEATVVEDHVQIGPYSIIGRHNTIQQHSSISHSVIWDYNHLGRHNELNGTIFTSHIQSEGCSYFQEGSVIGEHCIIDTKVSIQQNVKIWPSKLIRENSVVNSSLIWGSQISRSIYRSSGVTGIPHVEMTPDFAAKFASAYGWIAAKGQSLALSSSSQDFAKLIKNTISASLQSVGVNVIDLGQMLPASTRLAIRRLKTAGALHVQVTHSGDSPLCHIECYDEAGLPISKSLERKVENSFRHDDYAGSTIPRIGSISRRSTQNQQYVKQLLKDLEATRVGMVKSSNLKVVISTESNLVRSIVHEVLNTLGIQIVDYHMDPQFLHSSIKTNQADFGLWIDGYGRNSQWVGPCGETITTDQLSLMQLMSFFDQNKNFTLGIPSSSPSIIEALAEEHGCKVIRTKEDSRSIMEVTPELMFHPTFDGIYAASLIIRYMLLHDMKLEDLVERLPEFYLLREQIQCPWNAKGKIMRVLMEKTKGQRVDLLDGIKFYHPQGWVLLLPDNYEPVFKVIAHAKKSEAAIELVNSYRKQILVHLE